MALEHFHNAKYTAEEYLALERKSEIKHEFLEGEIYSFPGSKPAHNKITARITADVITQLESQEQFEPCDVYSSDQKVRTSPEGLFAYPDLTIVCDQPQYHDEHEDVITNPIVIVEVLSPSTAEYDRTKKFQMYRQIETLQDYVLVSQDEPRIQVYSRHSIKWTFEEASGLDGEIIISSIQCKLSLARVYRRVKFPPFIEPVDEKRP